MEFRELIPLLVVAIVAIAGMSMSSPTGFVVKDTHSDLKATAHTISSERYMSTSNGMSCDTYCASKGLTCILAYRDMERDSTNFDVATQRDGFVSCRTANGPANTNSGQCLCATPSELAKSLNKCEIKGWYGNSLSSDKRCSIYRSRMSCVAALVSKNSVERTVPCDTPPGDADYMQCVTCPLDQVDIAEAKAFTGAGTCTSTCKQQERSCLWAIDGEELKSCDEVAEQCICAKDTPQPVPIDSCQDSDDENIFEKGTTEYIQQGVARTHEDYCGTSTTTDLEGNFIRDTQIINEGKCEGSSFGIVNYQCEFGCSAGKCLPDPNVMPGKLPSDQKSDLTFTSIRLVGQNARKDKDFETGQGPAMISISVKNVGTSPSIPVTLYVYPLDALAEESYDPLNRGCCRLLHQKLEVLGPQRGMDEIEFDISEATQKAGTYKMIVGIDEGNMLLEAREDNNRVEFLMHTTSQDGPRTSVDIPFTFSSVPPPRCGNGKCDVGECESCPTDCGPVQCLKPPRKERPPQPEKLPEQQKVQACDGCLANGVCLPLGMRQKGRYCSLMGSMRFYKQDKSPCDNSFECASNQCANGVCISLEEEVRETKGLLERVFDWIRNIF